MKNKVLGLVILTILCLAFVGCPNKGKGSINAKFEFRGEKFNNTRSIMSLNSTDNISDSSFDVINAVYDSLGNKIDSYTPSKFELWVTGITLYNNEEVNILYTNTDPNAAGFTATFLHSVIDFANVGEIQFRDFKPGTYTGLLFYFNNHKGPLPLKNEEDIIYEIIEHDPSIIFTVPGGVGEGHYFEKDIKWATWGSSISYDVNPMYEGFDFDWLWEVRVNKDTYTIAPYLLFPEGLIQMGKVPRDGIWFDCKTLVFHSNKRKYFNGSPGGNYYGKSWGSEIGFPPEWGDFFDGDTLVSPFAGITIPEDAAMVNFILYWDLEDIIERYDNNTPDTPSDDIYIIARNFWERLTLIAEIEY